MTVLATEKSAAQLIQHWKNGCDSSASILGVEKLQQLLPYILHAIRTSTNQEFRNLPLQHLVIRPLSQTQAVLTTTPEVQRENPEMLESIQDICHTVLWQNIIVNGATPVVNGVPLHGLEAHHRPLDFHLRAANGADTVQIYATHGGDSFEETMAELARLYPSVVPQNVPPQPAPVQNHFDVEETPPFFCQFL